jgi:hypothetical protein
MTTSFWLNNPNILFKTDELSNMWPSAEMTFEGKLNAMSRLVILLTGIGFLITHKTKVVLSGIVTLGAIILLYFIKKNKATTKEGYTDRDLYNVMNSEFTKPTTMNPVMNILLPEINDNPHRYEALPASNPIVEDDINEKTKNFVTSNFNDEKIDERLFNDLGDNFTFEQSMRAWHPMPNTTIPNDQKAFTDYCYGDMIACRDETNNEIACLRNSPPRWTNY